MLNIKGYSLEFSQDYLFSYFYLSKTYDFLGESCVYLSKRLQLMYDDEEILFVRGGHLKGKIGRFFPSFLKKTGYFFFLSNKRSFFLDPIKIIEMRVSRENSDPSLNKSANILDEVPIVLFIIVTVLIVSYRVSFLFVLVPWYIYETAYAVFKKQYLEAWYLFTEHLAEKHSANNNHVNIKKAIVLQAVLVFIDLPMPTGKSLKFTLLLPRPERETHYILEMSFKERQVLI